MTWLFFVPILYLTAVAQTSLVDLVAIGHVVPDLFALVALAWVLLSPDPRAFLVAGVIGLAEDLVSPGCVGLGAGCFLAVGFLLSRMRGAVAIDSLVARTVAVGVSVCGLVLMLTVGQWLFGQVAIPATVAMGRAAGVGMYTAALSIPIWAFAARKSHLSRTSLRRLTEF
jgi:rod shape-determining protein MreD